jgi:hypothetical protein
MIEVIILVIGMVLGGGIVVGIWWLEQKSGTTSVIRCRKNMYWGTPITSSVADLARLEYLASGNLQKMIDFLIASLSDNAALQIISSNASEAGYGPSLAEAGGMAKAATSMAVALENLSSGDMVKEIAAKEQEQARKTQI